VAVDGEAYCNYLHLQKGGNVKGRNADDVDVDVDVAAVDRGHSSSDHVD